MSMLSFRRRSCVTPGLARNSYLLLPEFTSARGTISREQPEEVNKHASDKTPISDAGGTGLLAGRRGDRERGDLDLLGGLEYGDDRAGEDDADGPAGRSEGPAGRYDGIKELSQHVVPQRLGRLPDHRRRPSSRGWPGRHLRGPQEGAGAIR